LFLLDTNVLLWALGSRGRVNQDGLDLLTDPSKRIYLSAASTWEIAIKYQLGKIRLPKPPPEFVREAITELNLIRLDVSHRHAVAVWNLPLHHRDPFDRLLIAQAQAENLIVLTIDEVFKKYDVETIICRA
jgi:PIN domain nuclease of toxin-antitoxin system